MVRALSAAPKTGRFGYGQRIPPARERFYEGNWTPIKFSQDGRVLAAIDDQSKFVLLNLRTGEPDDQLQLQKPMGSLGRRDQRRFAHAGRSLARRRFRVWDLPSRKSVT